MKKGLIIVIYFIVWNNYSQNKSETYPQIKKVLDEYLTASSDTTNLYIQKANTLLKTNNNKKHKAEIKAYEAFYLLYYKSKFEEAKALNTLSLKANKSIKNTSGIAFNYYNIAQIYHRKSDFVNALKNYHKGIIDAQKSNYFAIMHRSYIGISGIYLDQRDYQKALLYSEKSISLYLKSKNLFHYATSFAFKAETYRMMKSEKNAEKYFKKAYSLHLKNNRKDGMAWVLSNWSLIYEDDITRSVMMELDAEILWNQISPSGYLALNNLGNIAWGLQMIAENDSIRKIAKTRLNLKSKNDYLNASESYYSKAISMSKKTKTPAIYLYFSEYLAKIQAKRNNYKEAYSNLLVSKKLNDSLYSQESKNNISAIENAKKIAIKDKQLEINKLTIEKNKTQKVYFAFASILFMMLGILLFFLYRNKLNSNLELGKLNRELEKSNEIKNRFFTILNHDLRSPVAQILQFFHFKNEKLLENENLEEMEKKMALKAERLLFSMEDLLLWGKSQMSSVELQKKDLNIATVFDYLKVHFSYLENYTFEFQEENINIKTDEDVLKTICRNLTANSVKVLENHSNKKIIWKSYQEKETKIIEIIDFYGSTEKTFENLITEKDTVSIKSGLGLQLIRELSTLIDVEVKIISLENQTTIKLLFSNMSS